jgi:F-type H+-transporting ATPase subunit b
MSHPGIQEAASNNNFLIPNMTFVVELVLFLIILGLLARFVLPRVQGALRERRAMVAQQLEDAERARQQLVEAERAYQRALQDARSEASRIREDARAEAQHTVEELRSQAQAESARMVARGEEQLRSQRAAIMRDLRAEIGTLAVELSEKIVDQPLAQDAEVSGTVDSFLAGLAADERARSGAEA